MLVLTPVHKEAEAQKGPKASKIQIIKNEEAAQRGKETCLISHSK